MMMYELLLAGAALFHPQQIDSLGTETVNGKVYVIHKVDEKETLYAISRRYGASIDEIKSSNPGLTSALEVGQIIKVPYNIKTSSAAGNAGTHKVAPGETMYSISRSYGVSVADLKKWNNLNDNTLSVGQELVVKKGAPPTGTQSSPSQEATSKPAADGLHTVAMKETLYSIARKYGVSVTEIKQWNNLTSDELQVGQSVYVASPTQKQPSSSNQSGSVSQSTTISQQKPVQQDRTTASQPSVDKNEPAVASTTKPVNDASASNTSKPQTIRISESLKNSDEITEAGVAELIEGTEGNRKYLALHRTAPVGTILKVRNEMNNREVFVRVMGKLPDSALNDKVLIKISRSAYDRLGAIDPKFRVELTYYK